MEDSIASLKLIKVKQKVNEKLFTKMLKNSMSPEKQRKIKNRYDNYVSLNSKTNRQGIGMKEGDLKTGLQLLQNLLARITQW